MIDSFYLLIAVAVCLVWTTNILVQNRLRHHRKKAALRDSLRLLLATYSQFFNMKSLLETHSSKYRGVLSPSGYDDLVEIMDHLSNAIHDCENLLRANRLADADALLKFLTRPASKSFGKIYQLSNANLKKLEDWQQSANQIISRCTIQLHNNLSMQQPSPFTQQNQENKTMHDIAAIKVGLLNQY